MKKIIAFTVPATLSGCQTAPTDYPTVGVPTDDPNCPRYTAVKAGFYGGDGSSEAQAVEMVGVEYTSQRWLAEKYPNHKIITQSLATSKKSKRNYDVITFETGNGQTKQAWFWISGGFTCLLKAMK